MPETDRGHREGLRAKVRLSSEFSTPCLSGCPSFLAPKLKESFAERDLSQSTAVNTVFAQHIRKPRSVMLLCDCQGQADRFGW